MADNKYVANFEFHADMGEMTELIRGATDASQKIEKLNKQIEVLKSALDEKEELILELEVGTGLKSLNDFKNRVSGTLEDSKREFRTFISSVNLDSIFDYGGSSDRTNELQVRLHELMESIGDGAITVGYAISEIKSEFGDLVNMFNNRSAETSLGRMSAALEGILNTIGSFQAITGGGGGSNGGGSGGGISNIVGSPGYYDQIISLLNTLVGLTKEFKSLFESSTDADAIINIGIAIKSITGHLSNLDATLSRINTDEFNDTFTYIAGYVNSISTSVENLIADIDTFKSSMSGDGGYEWLSGLTERFVELARSTGSVGSNAMAADADYNTNGISEVLSNISDNIDKLRSKVTSISNEIKKDISSNVESITTEIQNISSTVRSVFGTSEDSVSSFSSTFEKLDSILRGFSESSSSVNTSVLGMTRSIEGLSKNISAILSGLSGFARASETTMSTMVKSILDPFSAVNNVLDSVSEQIVNFQARMANEGHHTDAFAKEISHLISNVDRLKKSISDNTIGLHEAEVLASGFANQIRTMSTTPGFGTTGFFTQIGYEAKNVTEEAFRTIGIRLSAFYDSIRDSNTVSDVFKENINDMRKTLNLLEKSFEGDKIQFDELYKYLQGFGAGVSTLSLVDPNDSKMNKAASLDPIKEKMAADLKSINNAFRMNTDSLNSFYDNMSKSTNTTKIFLTIIDELRTRITSLTSDLNSGNLSFQEAVAISKSLAFAYQELINVGNVDDKPFKELEAGDQKNYTLPFESLKTEMQEYFSTIEQSDKYSNSFKSNISNMIQLVTQLGDAFFKTGEISTNEFNKGFGFLSGQFGLLRGDYTAPINPTFYDPDISGIAESAKDVEDTIKAVSDISRGHLESISDEAAEVVKDVKKVKTEIEDVGDAVVEAGEKIERKKSTFNFDFLKTDFENFPITEELFAENFPEDYAQYLEYIAQQQREASETTKKTTVDMEESMQEFFGFIDSAGDNNPEIAGELTSAANEMQKFINLSRQLNKSDLIDPEIIRQVDEFTRRVNKAAYDLKFSFDNPGENFDANELIGEFSKEIRSVREEFAKLKAEIDDVKSEFGKVPITFSGLSDGDKAASIEKLKKLSYDYSEYLDKISSLSGADNGIKVASEDAIASLYKLGEEFTNNKISVHKFNDEIKKYGAILKELKREQPADQFFGDLGYGDASKRIGDLDKLIANYTKYRNAISSSVSKDDVSLRTAKLNIDTLTKLRKGFESGTISVRDFDDTLKGLKGNLESLKSIQPEKPVLDIDSAQMQIAGAIEKVKVALKDYGAAESSGNIQSKQAYDNIKALTGAYQSLSTRVKDGAVDAQGFENEMKSNNMILQKNTDTIKANGDAHKKQSQILKAFGNFIKQFFSAMRVVQAVQRVFKQMVEQSIKLESAFSQLKIVTGATNAEMEQFIDTSVELAKQLGVSVADVSSSIETFSRLGYNLDESSILSKFATILSNVAAVEVDDATKGLTSIIKGYQMNVDNAEHVADVLVSVGQSYAVSASEMMEAYEKTGAALYATGTDFEKSAGLIAAGNAAVQNASVVGTALKTVSARIRKSTADLEELGESSEDLAGGFSKYAHEIESVSGVQILEDGYVDKYRDLYDIFNDLADVWNDLSDTQQMVVAQDLGGQRQYQIIASILGNWKDAVGAYEVSMNSLNTATDANGIYMDTAAAKIAQFKASYEDLSQSLINSGLIKEIVDIGTGIVNAAKSLSGLTKSTNNLKTLLGLVSSIVVLLKGKDIFSKIFSSFTNNITSFISGIKSSGNAFLHFTTVFEEYEAAKIALAKAEQAANAETVASDATVIASKEAVAAAYGSLMSAVSMGVSLLMIAGTLISSAIAKQKERQEQLEREISDAAEKAIDEQKTLRNLIKEYETLVGDNPGVDIDNIEQAEDIQSRIVDLVGDQANGVDLVNSTLMRELGLLKEIELQSNKNSRGAIETNYLNAIKELNSSEFDDNVGLGTSVFSTISAILNKNDKNMRMYTELREALIASHKWDKDYMAVDIASGDNIKTLKRLKELQDDLLNTDIGAGFFSDNKVLEWKTALSDIIMQYEKSVESAKSASVDMMKSLTDEKFLESFDDTTISSIDDIKNFAEENYNAVVASNKLKEAIDSGLISERDIKTEFYELAKIYIPEYKDAIESLSSALSENITQDDKRIKGFEAELKTYSDLSDEYEKFKNALDIVETATTENQNRAGISQSTLKSLKEYSSAYAKYLEVEDGVLKLNTGKLKNDASEEFLKSREAIEDNISTLEEQREKIMSLTVVENDYNGTLKETEITQEGRTKLLEENQKNLDKNRDALKTLNATYNSAIKYVKSISEEYGVLDESITNATNAKNKLDEALKEDDYDAGYDKRIEEFENFEKVLYEGEFGSKKYKAYLEYFGLIGKSEQQVMAWAKANAKYFKEENIGLEEWLKTLDAMTKSGALDGIASYDSDSDVFWYDINKLDKFAQKLGWTSEMTEDFIQKYRMYTNTWQSRSVSETFKELLDAGVITESENEYTASLKNLIAYTQLTESEINGLVDSINNYNSSLYGFKNLKIQDQLDDADEEATVKVKTELNEESAKYTKKEIDDLTNSLKTLTVGIDIGGQTFVDAEKLRNMLSEVVDSETGAKMSLDEINGKMKEISNVPGVNLVGEEQVEITQEIVDNFITARTQAGKTAEESSKELIDLLSGIKQVGGEDIIIGADVKLNDESLDEIIADRNRVSIDLEFDYDDDAIISQITTTASEIESIIGRGWEYIFTADNTDVYSKMTATQELLDNLDDSTEITLSYSDGSAVKSVKKTLKSLRKMSSESNVKIKPTVDSEEATEEIKSLTSAVSALDSENFVINGRADIDNAYNKINDFLGSLREIDKLKTQKITISANINGVDVSRNAKGTNKAKEGLSLLGDEYSPDGSPKPELVVSDGYAYIAGEHGATLGYLHEGDRVYTADETKKILSGNGIRTIQAHANGTYGSGYGGYSPTIYDPTNGSAYMQEMQKTIDLWKHNVEMGIITYQQYIIQLEAAYRYMIDTHQVEAKEAFAMMEEVRKGWEEITNDAISDLKFSINKGKKENSYDQVNAQYKYALSYVQQQIANAIANGYSQDDDYLQGLYNSLWDLQSERVDILEYELNDIEFSIEISKRKYEDASVIKNKYNTAISKAEAELAKLKASGLSNDSDEVQAIMKKIWELKDARDDVISTYISNVSESIKSVISLNNEKGKNNVLNYAALVKYWQSELNRLKNEGRKDTDPSVVSAKSQIEENLKLFYTGNIDREIQYYQSLQSRNQEFGNSTTGDEKKLSELYTLKKKVLKEKLGYTDSSSDVIEANKSIDEYNKLVATSEIDKEISSYEGLVSQNEISGRSNQTYFTTLRDLYEEKRQALIDSGYNADSSAVMEAQRNALDYSVKSVEEASNKTISNVEAKIKENETKGKSNKDQYEKLATYYNAEIKGLVAAGVSKDSEKIKDLQQQVLDSSVKAVQEGYAYDINKINNSIAKNEALGKSNATNYQKLAKDYSNEAKDLVKAGLDKNSDEVSSANQQALDYSIKAVTETYDRDIAKLNNSISKNEASGKSNEKNYKDLSKKYAGEAEKLLELGLDKNSDQVVSAQQQAFEYSVKSVEEKYGRSIDKLNSNISKNETLGKSNESNYKSLAKKYKAEAEDLVKSGVAADSEKIISLNNQSLEYSIKAVNEKYDKIISKLDRNIAKNNELGKSNKTNYDKRLKELEDKRKDLLASGIDASSEEILSLDEEIRSANKDAVTADIQRDINVLNNKITRSTLNGGTNVDKYKELSQKYLDLYNKLLDLGYDKNSDEVLSAYQSYVEAFNNATEERIRKLDAEIENLKTKHASNTDVRAVLEKELKIYEEDLLRYTNTLSEAYQTTLSNINNIRDAIHDIEKDSIDDRIFKLEQKQRDGMKNFDAVERYVSIMEDINALIDAAYKEGYTLNDDYLQDLINQANKIEDTMNDLIDEIKDSAKDAFDDMLDYQLNMNKKAYNDSKDKLDKQLDDLKKFYDDQKDLLNEQKDEKDYLKESAEKAKAVADVEAEIEKLKYDNSAWASKRRLELQQQLKDAIDDRDEFEADHALDLVLKDLDDQYESQSKTIEDQIQGIEDLLNDPHALYNEALEDIKNTSMKQLYLSMKEYNRTDGDGNDEAFDEKWKTWYDSLYDYQRYTGETYKDTQTTRSTSAVGTVISVGDNVTVKKAAKHFSDLSGAGELPDDVIGGDFVVGGIKGTQILLKDKNGNIVGWISKSNLVGYASGTRNATPGLHQVDEIGSELVFSTADGSRYRMFSGGEKVLNAKATNFLYNFANAGESIIYNAVKDAVTNGSLQSISGNNITTNIHTGDIIINGNADRETVSEIRRAQRENVQTILREFNKLK